jgi:hypothetical protein
MPNGDRGSRLILTDWRRDRAGEAALVDFEWA